MEKTIVANVPRPEGKPILCLTSCKHPGPGGGGGFCPSQSSTPGVGEIAVDLGRQKKTTVSRIAEDSSTTGGLWAEQLPPLMNVPPNTAALLGKLLQIDRVLQKWWCLVLNAGAVHLLITHLFPLSRSTVRKMWLFLTVNKKREASRGVLFLVLLDLCCCWSSLERNTKQNSLQFQSAWCQTLYHPPLWSEWLDPLKTAPKFWVSASQGS